MTAYNAGLDMFAFNIRVFKICANVHIGQKMGIFSKTIVYVSLFLTICMEITFVLDVIFNGPGDFQRLCEDLPMTMAFFMVSYEYYNIAARKEDIEDLLGHIGRVVQVHRPDFGEGTYVKSPMGRMVDRLDKFGLGNLIFGLFCVICWIIRPFLTRPPRKHPFGNPWYPYEDRRYYLAYWGFQSYVALLGTINTINVHIFYGKVMAVICEQFDILGHSLNNVDEDIDNFYDMDKECIEKLILHRTKTCIKYHQNILICCKKLQKCISGILVCQFCFGISLCFAALASFSMSAFSGAFINLVNHIFLELSELYIFCWFANKLTEYGEKVTSEIFYSNWYQRCSKTKRMIRFIMMRCRKPVIIRAGNFLPVSIGSFIWIMQQSYSCFMVLRQVRND